MAQKFKVGDKAEHITKGECIIISTDNEGDFPVLAQFVHGHLASATADGRERLREAPSLMLTGRPFNPGDRVVIGGEKGVVSFVSKGDTKTPVNIDIKNVSPQDEIWITVDGRAWPGTPIIAEHDWEEEIETVAEKMESAINNIGEAAKNCGVLGNWPVDDAAVSPEEVRHIAEMQDIAEMQHKKMMEVDALKDQHNYARMALVLVGIGIELKAAALVTEIVKRILELGGEFSLDTACEVEARVNQMYKN